MAKPVILCVDDEKTVLTSLRQELELAFGKAFSFELAESAEEGLEILEELRGEGRRVALVISDQIMTSMKGDEFLIRVNGIDDSIGKILLTGETTSNTVGAFGEKLPAFRWTAKPWDSGILHQMVRDLTGC